MPNNLKIYAKAALSHQQINSKLKLGGVDGLEIQLLDEMIVNNSSFIPATEAYNLEEFSCYPIEVIHTPILPNAQDILLESIADKEQAFLIREIFYIANYFGKLQKKEIPIVFHSELHSGILTNLGNVWEKISACIYDLLMNFPYTKLLIENVSPFRTTSKKGEIHLANNWGFDCIKLCENLCSQLKTNRIGLVLDTCHQMMSEKYISIVYQAIEDLPSPDLSIDNYFKKYAPYLQLIHLCDMVGNGYGKGKHGVTFTEKTKGKLTRILNLHRKYCPFVPITIEIQESDYNSCENFIKTRGLIQEFLNESVEPSPVIFTTLTSLIT